jgi:hypothetical protein
MWIVLFFLVIGLLAVTPSLARNPIMPIAQGRGGNNPMMNGGMMNDGMMDSNGMGTIHQLFANHKQIHRTVQEIAGGIRATTESDNPQVTALIQSHVPAMYQQINKRQAIPMIQMAPSLSPLIRNAGSYQRQFQLTSKGIVVTETSKDPKMVAVIREHAREVSQFVKEGMPAMMDGRTR